MPLFFALRGARFFLKRSPRGIPLLRGAKRFFQAAPAALFLCLLAAALPSSACAGDAEGYKRTIRNGPATIVIPQDDSETKRLLGGEFRYMNRNHTMLISDLDQATLVRLALEDFQAYLTMLTRQLYTRALTSHRADNPEIPVVFLFKDRASYVKGLRNMGIVVEEGSESDESKLRNGYHYSGKDLSFILINYAEDYAFGLAVYAHELSHALMRMEYPGAPIWLNEGLATMFENCRIEGGQLQYRFGYSLRRLQSGQIIPLSRLFAATKQDFNGPEHAVFYDMAGLFCYFLYSRNQLIPLYIDMRGGQAKGVNGEGTVARVTGRAIVDLEKVWHEWLREQKAGR